MRHAGSIIIIAASAAVLGYSTLAGSSSPGAHRRPTGMLDRVPPRPGSPPAAARSSEPEARIPGRPPGDPPVGAPRGRPPRPFAEADGALREGTTVFDDAVPG